MRNTRLLPLVPFLGNGPVVCVIVAMIPQTVRAIFHAFDPLSSPFHEYLCGARCRYIVKTLLWINAIN